MTRGIDARLRKLESATAGHRDRQLFVIEGKTEAERQAQIDELIAGGVADPGDSFIHTGVKRSPASPYFCGGVTALMANVAANGQRIFDARTP